MVNSSESGMEFSTHSPSAIYPVSGTGVYTAMMSPGPGEGKQSSAALSETDSIMVRNCV